MWYKGIETFPTNGGKRHDHVLRDADKMLAALEIQSAKFSADYKDSRGRIQESLNLPKRETLILAHV